MRSFPIHPTPTPTPAYMDMCMYAHQPCVHGHGACVHSRALSAPIAPHSAHVYCMCAPQDWLTDRMCMCAPQDWLTDTAEVFKEYHSRTLHLDAFHDSVFELVDMYTITTDEDQYIGYMRKLIKSIAIADEKGALFKWRHPWPKASSSKFASSLKASLAARSEEELQALYKGWLSRQEEVRWQQIPLLLLCFRLPVWR